MSARIEMEHKNKVSELFKMNLMVENFQQLCCGITEKHQIMIAPHRRYTKFTVDEILKPRFGLMSHETCDYDSDGTYYSDTNGDFYSSSDECHDCEASSVEHITPTRDDVNVYHKYKDVIDRSRITVTQVREQHEEEGYTSSDSEAALDLRIERKKTPPKVTNELPAWVFCTRYSDRPSSGPRTRRRKAGSSGQRRNRTAFNDFQIHQLSLEFTRDQYLTEERRLRLATDLNLQEASIKVWFQNRRAKLKKENSPQPLAEKLRKQGLYNHKAVV